MLGDIYVLPFWPPFLTFWGLNTIFLGYFFLSTNTKKLILGTNPSRITSFWPQIPLCLDLLGSNFQWPVAHTHQSPDLVPHKHSTPTPTQSPTHPTVVKSVTCGCLSINQSNPVLLKERVRIPRTRRAGGTAMLWGRLPLDGVGSCRLFFTDDLHDNLSWVPASDKPHTFKSCFTHSSQVFFGRPGPFLPGTGLDLTLFISPLERMTCPNHLSRRSRTRMAKSHIPSLACSSSIDGSSDGLTPQIQRIIARSLRHSRWRAAEVMGQVSIPCNIELRTLELNRRPLRSKGTGLDVSKGRVSEWVIKFNGLSRTADSKVHIVHISRVIIACTLKSLSPPT